MTSLPGHASSTIQSQYEVTGINLRLCLLQEKIRGLQELLLI